MFKIKKGNFMKKVAAFAAALSVLCISTACGTKIDNTELKKRNRKHNINRRKHRNNCFK